MSKPRSRKQIKTYVWSSSTISSEDVAAFDSDGTEDILDLLGRDGKKDFDNEEK